MRMDPPVGGVSKQRLLDHERYMSIYAQFSSVTHYDMYSMNILDLHRLEPPTEF